jgi:surface protein
MGQQTILRVETGKTTYNQVLFPSPGTVYNLPVYESLDLYASVPIKINKSYAEIQDISKKNSDYSVPLSLPGSKKNNKFFETFYNVDQDTLYFDPTKRVPCQVLIDDVVYFKGYLRLNKIAIKESKVEYNVTLYSTLGDLFGKMGNNLLSDLNYSSGGWNGSLLELNITDQWFGNPYKDSTPPKYFFPVVHNGYAYDDDGNVATGTTRLFTSTKVGAWSSPAAAASAGVTDYNLNSPINGLFINQLKPALSVYHLTEKIFSEYGYTLRSDFKETPWFKQLYMYGYFSSENVLFSEKQPDFEVRPIDDVDVIISGGTYTYTAYLVKKGTGVPCYCTETVDVTLKSPSETIYINVQPLTYLSQQTFTIPPIEVIVESNASVSELTAPYYIPTEVGTEVVYDYGDSWNINKVMDPKIKQIDFIASLAKKFNLIFTPDLDEPNVIIMEPIQYYIGSGDIKDWSGKLSYDQGFTVEPAQNFVEAEIILGDKSDKDGGNAEFERIFGKVYGTKQVFSNTDFKSRVKKIETIFSPEIIRKWDVVTGTTGNVDLPLGINYSESSSDGDNGAVTWTYEGLKTNPKLFYYVDNASPFINNIGDLFTDPPGGVETLTVKISEPGTTNQNIASSYYIPIISHTSPIGNSDENKINNDTQSILFQSERSLNVGVQAYDAYSKYDLYTRFYENNINNLFNKNTRFLKGKFHLDLVDVLNIKPKELIKIKQQYFMWNKISQFNLTDQELTEVELVQYNNTLQEYPTRYFKYWYCDDPSTVYRFKTDMTNPDMTDTRWARSIRYDYLRGAVGSNTVTFGVKDPSQGTSAYVGCTIVEVDESEYDTLTYIDMEYDSLWIYTTDGSVTGANHDLNSYLYNLLGFRSSAGTQYTWINAFSGCTDFNSKSVTYGFTTGSSTTHGTVVTPTPTSTPITPTPTPTPYYNTDGSMIYSYSEAFDIDYNMVFVNGDLRKRIDDDIPSAYTTYLQVGDSVNINAYFITNPVQLEVTITRREFTNDNEDGDAGIKEYTVTPTISYGVDFADISFTVENTNQNCSFEYVLDIRHLDRPTPTATPISPTPVPTPTATPVFEPLLIDIEVPSDGYEVTLPIEIYLAYIDWGDGNIGQGESSGSGYWSSYPMPENLHGFTHTYATAGTYTIEVGVDQSFGWLPLDPYNFLNYYQFNPGSNVPSSWYSVVRGVQSWGEYMNPSRLRYVFNNAGTTNIYVPNYLPSTTTDISNMFRNCYNFNDSNVTTWDVSNVQGFTSLFYEAQSFNQNISGWNTSSAIFMSGMFYDAISFNQNIGSWDVSNATQMDSMFYYASSFNQDLSDWCVDNIPSEPINFDTGASSWVLPKPVWGTCPP